MTGMKLSRRATVASAIAGVASAALPARAQDFPSKPITIVVPFGPGTTNDVIARPLGQHMMGALGHSVIIDNRAGATGNIAADLTRDFSPVAFAGKGLYSMFVPNELPVKSVAELVELARQQPGKLNFAGYIGGVPQFLGEMLNRAAKINTVMVPYKSTPDALVDLLANRIQIWFTPVTSGMPVHSSKQARMIAVTGDTRAGVLPEIPTFKEAGYPDLTVEIAYFLLVAKGTPQPIVDKLYGAIDKALQDPKVKETLRAQGVDEMKGGPTELSAYLTREISRWSDIVKLSTPAAK